MRFRGEVRWFYLLLKCVRIGEKADCTHAVDTVLLLRNPLRRRRPRPRRRLPQPSLSPCHYPSPPSLHHQSSRSDPLRPFLSSLILIIPPNLPAIYTLQQKSSILPYKSRKTYGRIYPSNFFRERQKEALAVGAVVVGGCEGLGIGGCDEEEGKGSLVECGEVLIE